jgi:hypothetical protein
MIWKKNAAHTYDGPQIFGKRKNVVCAKFLHRLFCKDFCSRILRNVNSFFNKEIEPHIVLQNFVLLIKVF